SCTDETCDESEELSPPQEEQFLVFSESGLRLEVSEEVKHLSADVRNVLEFIFEPVRDETPERSLQSGVVNELSEVLQPLHQVPCSVVEVEPFNDRNADVSHQQ